MRNLRKHGIDFADAVHVLEDAHAITITDESRGELRFVTIGMDALGRIVVVVHASRGSHTRIISARKADRRERQEYEG